MQLAPSPYLGEGLEEGAVLVMLICRYLAGGVRAHLGVVAGDAVYALPNVTIGSLLRALETSPQAARRRLEVAADSPAICVWAELLDGRHPDLRLLPPLDQQEVWAAGVTYQRSAQAREEESQQSGIYDRVYAADRPELFFKATPSRVVGSGEAVYIRSDARWSVPEPELALLVGPGGSIVGYAIGNDVSSRDIEGANPLYLPQAKVHARCCALGPAVLLADDAEAPPIFSIRLRITRGEKEVFGGETSTARMKRSFADLVRYLIRDNLFPAGVFLLTGTGVVPPDDFTLEAGDVVEITIPAIGALRNAVERAPGGLAG